MRLRIATTFLCIAVYAFADVAKGAVGTGPVRSEISSNEVAAVERGRREARRDLTNGVAIIKFAGLPAPESSTYWNLLSKRCGASVQPIAGCLVTSELEAYREGYNKVSRDWVERKYGTNIFEEVWAEAKKQYLVDLMASVEESRKKQTDKAPDPGRTDFYHVRSGDTFSKIANRKGVGLRELMDANPGVDPKKLQINQRLVLPR